MDCKTFQQHLEDLIDDAPGAAERSEADRHLATCERCRELSALLHDDLGVLRVDPPADLTAAILLRTSGSACARARELLCDHVDLSLEDLDAALVRQHTAGCGDCRRVEWALKHLALDLPTMALLMPDAAFVGDVLAATLPRHERFHRLLGRLLGNWADAWQRLLQRPRFGLEAGYVGALALWALFGMSASPFSRLPDEALAALEQGPRAGIERTSAVVATLQTQLGDVTRQTWEASGRRGAHALDELTSDVGRRLESTADARGSLRRHGAELGDAALQLNLEQTTRAVRGISEGLGALWREINTVTDTDESQPKPTPGSDEPRSTKETT